MKSIKHKITESIEIIKPHLFKIKRNPHLILLDDRHDGLISPIIRYLTIRYIYYPLMIDYLE
jgi:hypothetical protein